MEKDKGKQEALFAAVGGGGSVTYAGVSIRVLGVRFAHGGRAVELLPSLSRGVIGGYLLLEELRRVKALTSAATDVDDGEAEVSEGDEITVDVSAVTDALESLPLDQLKDLGAALTASVGLLDLHVDIDVTGDDVPLELGLLLLAVFLEQSKLGKVAAAAGQVLAGAAAFEGLAVGGGGAETAGGPSERSGASAGG